MTKKNEARKLAREIRRVTGVPLPVAGTIAKKYVRGDTLSLILNQALAPYIMSEQKSYTYYCSWFECEMPGYHVTSYVVGKRGKYIIEDYSSH